VVARVKVGAVRFDRSGGYAPVPVLFSSEPEQASHNIKKNPQFIKDCIQLLSSKFLHREELTIQQAEEFVLNPREGKYKQPMLESWKAAMDRPKEKEKPASSPKPSKEEKGE